MKLGSLFSGAGLGDLGWMMAGFEIAWQVEIDKYCQKVLDLRFPESKKYHDIKTIKGKDLEPVDIVAGGFPCQPFSVAGNQRGDQDDRNLWPEMFRIIKEVKPAWVVGENVSGIINIYLDNVLNDLASEGYATRTFVFPAHALGANHRRERIWIVGYANNGNRNMAMERKQNKKDINSNWSSQAVADSRKQGLPESTRRQQPGFQEKKRPSTGSKFSGGNATAIWRDWWSAEPRVGRVAHGVPRRVDRLKCLGNGQVSVCTYFIGQTIMEHERLARK